MRHTFNNVEYCYRFLTDISGKLPQDTEFICQHRDDCGISLTEDQHDISIEELVRRRAVLMVYDDQKYKSAMKEKDYLDIMEYFDLCDRFSLQAFIKMCKHDIDMLSDQKQVISNQLGTKVEEVSVVFNVNGISLFLMRDRENKWERECFLKFLYDSDLLFLKDISYYQDKAHKIVDVFNESRDIETTVGLKRREE